MNSVGAGLIILAAVCFGTLGPISRFAEEAGVGALGLVTWRAGLGAAVMVGFLAARTALGHRPVVRLRNLPVKDRWMILAAAAANTILNLAVFIAFLRISIALALLVFYLYPAFVALVSVAWFGERLDRLRWAALALSLAGMVLVVVGAGELGQVDALGIGLAFVGAVMQSFYVLAARHGFANVPGPQAAAMTMGGAMAFYLVIAIVTGQAAVIAQPLVGFDAFLPVLLAGVIGAGIPTVSYIGGIRLLGAPRASILATLEPIVGVGLAALLLGEQPMPIQLVGGSLILGAAVLLQVRSRGEVADHEGVA